MCSGSSVSAIRAGGSSLLLHGLGSAMGRAFDGCPSSCRAGCSSAGPARARRGRARSALGYGRARRGRRRDGRATEVENGVRTGSASASSGRVLAGAHVRPGCNRGGRAGLPAGPGPEPAAAVCGERAGAALRARRSLRRRGRRSGARVRLAASDAPRAARGRDQAGPSVEAGRRTAFEFRCAREMARRGLERDRASAPVGGGRADAGRNRGTVVDPDGRRALRGGRCSAND